MSLIRNALSVFLVALLLILPGACTDSDVHGPNGEELHHDDDELECEDDEDCPDQRACGQDGHCLDAGTTGDTCAELEECCEQLTGGDQSDCEDQAASAEPTREADCADLLITHVEAGECF